MDFWIAKLREQAAQIAAGDYLPREPAFTRGPAGVLELSQDLDALARRLAERDTAHRALSHEVHHRVKNNLQIVTSLLSMQVKGACKPDVREALEQTRARMSALALIHRMLYEQSDLDNENTIDVKLLLIELCAQLRLWNRKRLGIEFASDASSIAVPLDSAMPLALFAVEAVTNAFAHAFPHGRSGKVTLHHSVSDSGQALLSIADDGVGFEYGNIHNSMGLQLIQGFAHQLGGELEIVSKIGEGTQLRLTYAAAG